MIKMAPTRHRFLMRANSLGEGLDQIEELALDRIEYALDFKEVCSYYLGDEG